MAKQPKRSSSSGRGRARAQRDAAAEAAAARQTAFALSDEAVESALLTGEFAGPLEDYFGPELYAELRQLKREEAARAVRGGPRVLILPGIMGSRLGRRRAFPFDDIYWLDPIDIARGRLYDLRMPGGDAVDPLGAILLTYLKLKLRLRRDGYDADFHPFDWRLSIAELGTQLAARIENEGGADVSIVAHSMGGLVARWAIGRGGARCRRLVMLGTPNGGSYAPVMALRAVYPVVRKVAALDLTHSAEELASQVFSTFPGLTQMFPAPELLDGADVYDVDAWPDDGLRPRKPILDGIDDVRAGYRPGGAEVVMIAGIDRETPVGVRTSDARDDAGPGFVFRYSDAGDGTVPLSMALLPDAARTYYIAESHGSLPNNRHVAAAVRDILARGETNLLPDRWAPRGRRPPELERHEVELRVDPYDGRRAAMLSQRELRHLLDGFAAPDARDEVAPAAAAAVLAGVVPPGPGGPGYAHAFDRIVVGRRRQHRIDLRFALGSITEVDARAIALGLFRGVAPSGAARALDARLGGAIRELLTRRMFGGGVGEIFMLPTGRHPITAELIAFVGLGEFDRMNDDVLRTAAENVIRTFVRARVEEFSTVLFGGGSGESPASALRNLLTGFFRGLIDADADHGFRRIVLCEHDPERYTQLKEELYRLSSTALCQDVELTFDEVRLPAAVEPVDERRVRPAAEDPVYLIVREERAAALDDADTQRRTARRGRRRAERPAEFIVRSSLLTSGGKATVVTGAQRVGRKDFEAAVEAVVDPGVHDFAAAGAGLTELLLADPVRRVLPRHRSHHLVIVHDAPLSRVPWEAIAFAQDGAEPWLPAASGGISHRYAADNLSIAKWLAQRVEDEVLKLLLVVDPTGDLEGARIEGKRVLELFGNQPGCVVDRLYQGEATRSALLRALGSGEYDVVHYAGHAFFDPRNPERSGLICHDHVPLTGADVAGLSALPALMFFNACESARVRAARPARSADARRKAAKLAVERRLEHLDDAVGIAEAFMRGGVANFLGTYWPVGDAAAERFAATFYDAVLRGQSLGDSIQSARAAVRDLPSRDWADYIFYGDSDFVLKRGIP